MAFLVCGVLLPHLSGTHAETLAPKLLASISLAALILGATAVLLGIVATARRLERWRKGLVGLCLGSVTLAFTAITWIASFPPSISLDDLCSVRDRATPVMEELTGLAFKSPVIVELGSNEFEMGRLQDDTRRRLEHPQFNLPFDFVGLYDQERKILYVMPDGIGKMQREGVLKRGRAHEIARAVLVDELVHALDDQNGMMESKAELLQMPKVDQNRFWIRRAIHEGRSSFFGEKVCRELGIRPLSEFLTGSGGDGTKPGIFAEMMLGMIRFVYGDGPRFFKWLDSAGRTDLISRASLHAPPMLHYIERPDIYAGDVDSGMEERFAEIFAYLAEVFPSTAWKAGYAWSHGLVEIPRSILVDPHLSGRKAEFQRLPIAAWLGSFTKTAGEGRASLRLWRFPDEDVAAKGVDLRLGIWRENATRDAKRLQEESRECPEADSYVFTKRIDLKDATNPATDFRCLARSGSFVLEARFRESTGETSAKPIADKLVRGLLVALGASD
jgi:hypothetical protein